MHAVISPTCPDKHQFDIKAHMQRETQVRYESLFCAVTVYLKLFVLSMLFADTTLKY